MPKLWPGRAEAQNEDLGRRSGAAGVRARFGLEDAQPPSADPQLKLITSKRVRGAQGCS